MLLLRNFVVMEQKATREKNLELVCVWWYNQNKIHEHGNSVSVTQTDDYKCFWRRFHNIS